MGKYWMWPLCSSDRFNLIQSSWGCCEKLAPLVWKLSHGSCDGAPAVQIPLWRWGLCCRQVRTARESWFLNSWRRRDLNNNICHFPFSSCLIPPTNEVSLSPFPLGVFFYLSSAVNPIIYNLLSQRFRMAFLSVISPGCKHWAPKHTTSKTPPQQSIFMVEDHNLVDSAEDTSVPGTNRTSVCSSQLSTGLWFAMVWCIHGKEAEENDWGK